LKEHEKCPPTETHDTSRASTADTGTRTDAPSTDAPAVVSIGTRAVVEIGPEEATPTWEERVAADPTLLTPDCEWDRTDDYAMTGQRAHDNDMEELRQANTEARIKRNGVRFG